jgi:16S rRNA (guanine(966)-N(2))-methyltransferase RsmD
MAHGRAARRPMTRIVAGTLGGRRISTPAGRDTRPTSDRVREALFSTLDSLTEVHGARFADLFAGSGAVGLEAASRGASAVLLVESDTKAARIARANIAALGLEGQCELTVARVLPTLARGTASPYDIVFADPPYSLEEPELGATLEALPEGGWLAPDAVVVVERSSRSPEPVWPAGVTRVHRRRYGETTLWYGRRA